LFKDFAGKELVATADDGYLRADKFTDDSTKPELQKVGLDMNLAKLTLSFSETVDVSTLVALRLRCKRPRTARRRSHLNRAPTARCAHRAETVRKSWSASRTRT
jgi:hypothetical protein